MRIEPTGAQPAIPQVPTTRPNTRAADPAPVAAPVPVAAPGSAEEFALTGQLAALLSTVREFPAVRPDVVAVAVARLAAGDFNTPQAAATAAVAVVAAQPSIAD